MTDNGSPALSATNSFQIAVLDLPKVSSVQMSNGLVNVRWESYPNRRYKVETTLNLVNPEWQQVGSDVIATGTSTVLTLGAGTDPQRFYRVLSYNE